MAVSVAGLCLFGLDVLLRRLVFPVVLLSAIIFRYNLLSLVYLLLLIVCFILPGPRLKSQKWSFVIYLIIVLVFSGVASLGQALFQFTLLSSYKNELNMNCSSVESIWRQIGFVKFDIPAVHVVRLLLPDVIVFLGSLVTLGMSLSAVRLCKSKDVEGVGGEGSADDGGGAVQTSNQNGAESGTNEMGSVLSGREPPYPSTVQCYYQLPKLVTYLLDLAVFILLMFSGVAVPSILSYVYYVAFLMVLVIWSVHLKLKILVRVLRAIVMIYSALHLVLLDLYQFQEAQVLVNPLPLNTTHGLLARLFGLTPVIMTDCDTPYALALHSDVHYTRFLSPALIFLLLVILSTDFRLWLFTPKLLWRTHKCSVYFLPVHDQIPTDSRLHCLSKQGPLKRQGIWTNYGSTERNQSPARDVMTQFDDSPIIQSEDDPPVRKSKRVRITWAVLYNRAADGVTLLWSLILKISFILSIITMMAWSVLYPSWPSLVLLLWTCAIWLIPKINPRDSLFYTSPVLVLYSLILVHIQYIYSVDLTHDEFPRDISLGPECPRELDIGCRTWVLFVKSLFTIVFFTSFHEFVLLVKEKIKERRGRTPDHALDTDGRESPSEEEEETAAARAKVYKSLYRLVSTYWILAVLGAFLLVTLTGPPTLLKSVYMVFFFLFLITYQVTEKFWFYFSFLVWWLLVFYAALDLILVYTYQLKQVRDGWSQLYNNSGLAQRDISMADLFNTIGLVHVDSFEFRVLAISLIPPAVFIAVLALQLRYFTPKSPFATQIEEEAATAIDFVSILPQFIRTSIKGLSEEDEEMYLEENDEVGEGTHTPGDVVVLSSPGGDSEDGHVGRGVQRQPSEVSSSIHPSTLQSCYRFMVYAFQKTRQLLLGLLDLTWRFLELHLPKIVILTLFATCLSELSALYWILLAALLLLFPLPVCNFLSYPLLTMFLGALSVAKMVYQTPLIKSSYLDLSNGEQCQAIYFIDLGRFFDSITSDASWFGFTKKDNFSGYVALPIVSSLFMTLWFSARRYQANHRRSKGVKVQPYEKGSLFLGVTRKQADRSILSAAKYLVNHFFEMYGVEVCWAMLAITVAVRIDVYGIYYGVVLGLLLLIPRPFLGPVWFVYMFLHGLVLLGQYFFLLGAPPGVCFSGISETVYPWSNLTVDSLYPGMTVNLGNPYALKRWLFLPGDRVQILDKTLLYADFLVYLLVALQLRYFIRNPIKRGTPDQTNGVIVNFYKYQYWVDYCKMVVFQYSFWFSLFILFLTAAIRVSLFGLVYLLLGLFFLYRGQDMLRDRQKNRHRSWAFLRLVTWLVLLIGVCLQVVDCVSLSDMPQKAGCTLAILFKIVCNKLQYYGSAPPTCPGNTMNVGLWVDALNFAVLTLQIILFDTEYSEQVKTELEGKEQNATYFRDVFDSKVEEQRALYQEERERELHELRERAAHLTETQQTIDHILYAGLSVPDNLEIRTLARKPRSKTLEEASESQVAPSDTLSLISEEPAGKASPTPSEAGALEKSVLAQTWDLVKGFILKLVDAFIAFLESSSIIYRAVVTEIKTRQSSGEMPVETRPFVQPTSTYGSTEASPDTTHSMDVPVEVHSPADDPNKAKPEDVGGATEEVGGAKPVFDIRGDALVEELHLAPSSKERDEIQSYEDALSERVKHYTTRPRRLLTAIYYVLLSHSEYLVYFLLILNIVLNGSVLSIIYAVLLFSWGLLSIPWPTRRFWITLILYTMFVLIIKYGFQFYNLDEYLRITYNINIKSGLYPLRILGVLHRVNFFTNAVWDILLLIAILFHRSLLRQYGLWNGSKQRKNVSSIFLTFWESFKTFFSRLLNPELSQGARNYYTVMLFFDVLCFFTIVFGVNSFGIGFHSDQVAVAEFIRTNYVPLPFVIMLLLQFLSMLVDRAIYLRHSVIAKLVFQVILLLGWHIWLFFVLPSDAVNARPFTDNTAAQCIYFFKCCYFIVSSLQIASGYPTRILGNLFTKSYDIFSWLAFLTYRVIPLLPELRSVMDWGFTDTTLSLFNWFKVQEIYAQLFLVKVQRERELEYPRSLGEKETWVSKVFLGGVLIAALVLLIWGPLLVMSVISSSSEPDPPVEVSIRLTLSGYEPIIRMTAPRSSVVRLDLNEYNSLRDQFKNSSLVIPVFERQYMRADFTRVSFPGVSSTTWAISPPSRSKLIQELENTLKNSNVSVPLEFHWTITRNPSAKQASETVSGVTSRQLNAGSVTDQKTIQQFLTALNNENGIVELNNLYPTIIRAPPSAASTNLTDLTRFLAEGHPLQTVCHLTLNNSVSEPFIEYWSLQCDHINFTNLFNSSSLDMYIYSDPIAQAIFSGIASIGIIGLYVSVVLVIGRFIRTYISALPTRLYIEEILNPDPLLKLCNDIFLVRECKEFQLEEILVGKLFYIFKSPDKVAKVTELRPKVKTD